jgi:hypothetical protein
MFETLKKVAKGAIVFGIVGALLALSAPYIASALSGVVSEAVVTKATAMGTAQGALWEGAFFGTFGALHAAVAPMLDAVFKESPSTAATVVKTQEPQQGHGLNITNVQMQPDVAVAADVDVGDKTKSFVQALENKTAAHMPHLQLVK